MNLNLKISSWTSEKRDEIVKILSSKAIFEIMAAFDRCSEKMLENFWNWEKYHHSTLQKCIFFFKNSIFKMQIKNYECTEEQHYFSTSAAPVIDFHTIHCIVLETLVG